MAASQIFWVSASSRLPSNDGAAPATTKRWGTPQAVKRPLQKVPISTGQSTSSS
jgi:hypothetical protein